jgi:hypothetical protein
MYHFTTTVSKKRGQAAIEATQQKKTRHVLVVVGASSGDASTAGLDAYDTGPGTRVLRKSKEKKERKRDERKRERDKMQKDKNQDRVGEKCLMIVMSYGFTQLSWPTRMTKRVSQIDSLVAG